jgi:hypothetical protein
MNLNTYALPEHAYKRLEKMVDGIEASPGRTIDPHEFETSVDTRKALTSLPEGISEDDFAGILKLAMLTECATDTYAYEISTRARQFSAGWLERFNERVWKPDETMHAEPFKLMLLGLGFSEAELDREIAETQAKEFEHTGGDSPVHVTTFGMVQEYLTDHWHGLIAKLLRPALPEAASMAYRIKQRETLHTVWYRDMTVMQLEANPDFVADVAFELARFRLPGNALIPDLQAEATRWLPLMGADFSRIARDLVRLLYMTVGSPRMMGRLAIELTETKGKTIGPVRPHQLHAVLNRFNGWGYGLVGEAVLERMGLEFMFQTDVDKARRQHDVTFRVRERLRTWLARQLPNNVGIA